MQEELAKAFATKAHADQIYGDGRPYSVHLEAVAQVAKDFFLSDDLVAAAWLHDVLEDTPYKPLELRARFGPEIAYLVEAVTNEPGKNRIEKAARTLPKTFKAGQKAVSLKLCDRIANVEACINGVGNPKLFRMYVNEYEDFQELLEREKHELINKRLWERLDKAIVDGLLKKLHES